MPEETDYQCNHCQYKFDNSTSETEVKCPKCANVLPDQLKPRKPYMPPVEPETVQCPHCRYKSDNEPAEHGMRSCENCGTEYPFDKREKETT